MGAELVTAILTKMKKILLFSLTFLIIESSALQSSTKLISIQILGKRQLYSVGNFLRERYNDFITSDPNEVTVHSSHDDRCIQSALSHMAALYKPTQKWRFEDSFEWQPIPIHSVPEHHDRYLSSKSKCPRADEETKRYLDEKVPPLLDEHKEMIENLTKSSGLKVDNALNLFLLQDTLQIEREGNKKVPGWAESYYEELNNVTDIIFRLFLKPPVVNRLRIGPLIGRIASHMIERNSKENSKVKVHVYSTHDHLIGILLEALKVSDGKRPPYAATLVFELHEDENGDKFVRLVYFNSPTPELDPGEGMQTLTLEGCEEFCPLPFFENYTKPLVPDHWKHECNSHVSSKLIREEERSLFDI